MFALGAMAAFIAAVIVIMASALSSNTTPKVGFHLTVTIAGREVKAIGTTYLDEGRFAFEGSRLSFSGRIDGDEVRIDGQAISPDQATTRAFTANARRAGTRISTAVMGTDGRRMGALRLELPSE
jgi:hypothetical protein